MLEAALKYTNIGISVIPCNPTMDEGFAKKPFIKWEIYQKKRATKEQITEWWNKWPDAMIGAVTGAISGFFGIDGDTEEAVRQIEEIVPDNIITPTSKTPRGKHNLFAYHPGIRNYNQNNGSIKFHIRGEGGYVIFPPSVRANGMKYEWIVDPFETPFEKAPISLIDIINNNALVNNNILSLYRGDVRSDVRSLTETYNPLHFLTLGNRDNDLFHVANVMVKGGARREIIQKVLELLAKNCDPPFAEREINIKIDSAFSRAEKKERNLSQEIKEWVSLQNAYFFLTEAFKHLQILTSTEKNNAYVIMNRLVKDGIIEKDSKKSGCYRKVDSQADEIDIFSDEDTPLRIRWPLGIEALTKTMPKSIIIIAGESDAGKTGFLLNFSFLNMDNHKILYFSSEMGATELKDRISKFERPIGDWKKISFKERISNFADVIKPDQINIIDFLELHDEFYKVGGQIKDIFDKLNKGIAIIALQKKTGSEMGRGGDFSMEKARLYVSLSRDNTCKIIKAKNWVSPMIKPAGKTKKFVLYQGCKFFGKSDWTTEENNERKEQNA